MFFLPVHITFTDFSLDIDSIVASMHGLILVSYPDPNVRNHDYRLQYNITRYVHLGLGTRLASYAYMYGNETS